MSKVVELSVASASDETECELYLMCPEYGGHVHLFTNVSLKPDTVLGTPN